MTDFLPDDAYDPVPLDAERATGGLLIGEDEDGNQTITEAPARHRSQLWAGARKIEALLDSDIRIIPTRSGSYYRVGNTTVKYRGRGDGVKQQYLCLKAGHCCNNCPHTKRLDKWRKEHGTTEAPIRKRKSRKAEAV